MDIAIVTPTLYYGGGERQIEFLALGLKQRGHTVVVYCFMDDGAIVDILVANDIKVVRLYLRLIKNMYIDRNKHVFFNDKDIFRSTSKIMNRLIRLVNELWAALKLSIIFLKSKPAVVHLYQNQTKMAILVSKLCGIKKVIYTETSLIGDWFTPVQLFLMKFFWKFCDAVVVLSVAMRDHVLKLNLVVSSKIHLIPIMFPFPVTDSYTKKEYDKSRIQIGTIGRLTPEKGHIFFLKAAHLITKRFTDVAFIVAGDGYLKEELKKTTRDLGIEESVKFLGAFKNLKDVMGQIDIFVLSSLTEGMPLVLLEAMAYGKPIVATDVGGVKEVIQEGKTGFLVPSGNPEALAEAVSRLIDNPQQCIDFVNEIVKQFKDVYSSEKIIPQIEMLYQGGRFD